MSQSSPQSQTLPLQIMLSWTAENPSRRDDLIEKLLRQDMVNLIKGIYGFLEYNLSGNDVLKLSDSQLQESLISLYQEVQLRLDSTRENTRTTSVNSTMPHVDLIENNGVTAPNEPHWRHNKRIGLDSECVSQVDLRNALNLQGWKAISSISESLGIANSVISKLIKAANKNKKEELQSKGLTSEVIDKEIRENYIFGVPSKRTVSYQLISPSAQADVLNILSELEKQYLFSFGKALSRSEETDLRRAGYKAQDALPQKAKNYVNRVGRDTIIQMLEAMKNEKNDRVDNEQHDKQSYIYKIPNLLLDNECKPYIKFRYLFSPEAIKDIEVLASNPNTTVIITDKIVPLSHGVKGREP